VNAPDTAVLSALVESKLAISLAIDELVEVNEPLMLSAI